MASIVTIKRKPLEQWQKEDAARLLSRWNRRDPKISQARAATDWGIGETQAIVWQYLHGHIPLNLTVGVKFARGLNCSVADISPRLAKQLPPGGLAPAQQPAFTPTPAEIALLKALRKMSKGDITQLATLTTLLLTTYGTHTKNKRLEQLGWVAPKEDR